ncbi:MAG: ABC-type multidrug transport system, ATPase and permease component [Actinomycetia bacterium]|nr:ABC-type multidrug transport system, ATPase and permease component [Actinomycetes bacterium]
MWRRGVATLRRFIVAHPVPFTTSVIGSSVFALTSVLGTIVLGRVTDRIIIPAFKGHVASGTIWAGAIAIVVVAFIRSAGVITRRYYAGMTAAANMATLRHQIADRYLDVPLSFHREHTTGTLLAHADNDVMVASEVINPLPFSTGLMLLIVFSLIALFAIDPLLTLVGLVLFPAMFALNRFYTRRVELPAQTVQERVGDVSAITHESFEGVMVVKTLGRQDAEVQRLGRAADQLRVARVRVGALRALFEPTLDALPNLAIIVLLAVGGWRVSTGAVSPGDLVQAMALFTLLAFPMRVVGFLLEEMPRSVVALDRIDGVLAASPEPVPTDPRPLPSGGLAVEADGLGYEYVAGVPVLQDCDVRIASGEVVALVGPTGCGKTTLCELLAGLDRPERGVVRVGGIDLTAVARRDLRSSGVALVFQESFLFTDSIANNITIGTETIATDVTDAAMRWAARIAQVAGFVDSLPAGYDTSIGERGVTVSGGQRQRIALARALIRRPRFLLLDDATSAVDATVEARILHGLRDELDMTTLIVAHRVSTIALADRVLFMQEGRIVATGTHTELLATNRDYETMVRAYEQEVA